MKKQIILLGAILVLSVLLILVFSIPFNKDTNTYKINIKLTNVPNHLRISLQNWYTKDEVVKDFNGESSIDIDFTGSVSELSFFYLEFYEIQEDGKRIVPLRTKQLFIGNEEVTLTGEINNLDVITNSETQNIIEEWFSEAKHIFDPLRKVKSILFIYSQKGEYDSREYKDNLVIYKDLLIQEEEAAVDFISRNSHSKTSAFLLNRYYHRLSMKKVEELYRKLGETIKQSRFNDPIEIYLTTEVLEIGDYWYDFTAFNKKGDSILLSDVEQGACKHLLLVFSRRGCIACENSTLELKAIYEKHHEELEIVSYYQDISANDLKAKAESNQIEWTLLGTEMRSDRRTLRSYDVGGFPKFVLISPERKITYSWKRGYEKGLLLEKLDNYFKYSKH